MAIASLGVVFSKVESHQMPPPKRDSQPMDAERAKLLAWIPGHRRAAGSARRASGRAVLRQLTRLEYNNTVRATSSG
jgi:hypothetical protein